MHFCICSKASRSLWLHSIMGGNWRHLRSKYGMEECNVMKSWDEMCKNECEYVRVCEQIRECVTGGISVTWLCLLREECSTIIEFLKVKILKRVFLLCGGASSSIYIHARFHGDLQLHHKKLMRTVSGLLLHKWHIPPPASTFLIITGGGGRNACLGLDSNQHMASIFFKSWCPID